jgi:hypothetical protein
MVKRKKARQANAVKQTSYRKRNYEGLIPLDPEWHTVVRPEIRESSINSVENNPAIKRALGNMVYGFIRDCEKLEIPENVWKPVHEDIKELLTPFLAHL